MPGRSDYDRRSVGNSQLQRYAFQVLHSDLTDAAQSQAISLTGFPANVSIHQIVIQPVTAFSGGGTTVATVEIGDAADPDEDCLATDVFTGASSDMQCRPGVGTSPRFESAWAPLATFRAGGGETVAAYTAGSLWVHVYYAPVSAV